MTIEQLEQERNLFLLKHPELLKLQVDIDSELSGTGSERVLIAQELMLIKFQELNSKLLELRDLLERVRIITKI